VTNDDELLIVVHAAARLFITGAMSHERVTARWVGIGAPDRIGRYVYTPTSGIVTSACTNRM
jgi:hypothetical protein